MSFSMSSILEETQPKCNRRKDSIKLGWNDYAKAAHDEAREAFILWNTNSKPRHGPVFDLMKNTRARFKYALRYCKSVETRANIDALANKLLAKDDTAFWMEIK